VKLNRKPKLTAAQMVHARQLMDQGENGRIVARGLGVARSTLYAALKVAT
jgi:DNA-binding phage protein